MKQRQRQILAALKDMGDGTTTVMIAEKLGFNVNGVSQSLGAIKGVYCMGGKGGKMKWGLNDPERSEQI